MSRYIDIDDISLRKTISVGGLSAKALWRRIQQEPSIGIVRCKECKWYGNEQKKIYECCTYWAQDGGVLVPTKADDFCSYGVKKGADDE